MSAIELPASFRAPKNGPEIYTASAPLSMAAMPMSRFLAGASSSNESILFYSVYLLLGFCSEFRVSNGFLIEFNGLDLIARLLIRAPK